MVEFYRFNFQVGELVKNIVGGGRRIKIADAGMITADNEMAAAEILAADGGKNRFAGTGITGEGRKSGKDNFVFRIKVFNHTFITFNDIFSVKVARFLFTDDGVDKKTVAVFFSQRLQLNKFVAAVNDISGMKTDDF